MAEGCAPGLGKAIPVFRVADLAASVRYYVDCLDFRHDWGDVNEGFASVSRDQCTIFLCVGDQGHTGAWTWIGVPDCAALHEEMLARGARIRHRPTNYYWALEMQVEDPDGNVLRMGSDPLPGQPFGEWLDMNGRVWPPPTAEPADNS